MSEAIFLTTGMNTRMCVCAHTHTCEYTCTHTHIIHSHTHPIPSIPNQPWEAIIPVLYFNCVARSHRMDFRKASVRRKSIFFSFSFNALSVTLSERKVNQSHTGVRVTGTLCSLPNKEALQAFGEAFLVDDLLH